MKRKMWKILSVAVALGLIFGCASGLQELRGKEKLEARDWLHAGDLAYQVKSYDEAQYFYELVISKYPNTYYEKKAKENLGYVKFQKGLIGKTIEAGKDLTDPVF